MKSLLALMTLYIKTALTYELPTGCFAEPIACITNYRVLRSSR